MSAKKVTASRTRSKPVPGEREKVGDAALERRTGKRWERWFAVLDGAGVATEGHRAIVAHLHGRHGLDGWWAQTVAVGYEQARGLRAKHQKPDGFQISRSKTIAAPLAEVYRAWSDGRRRARWLPGAALTVRTATPAKTMRITWEADGTSVEAYFLAKDPEKSQVVVQHSKLPDAQAAERMKAHWGAALERLQAALER
jgi:uncharacterized protein YndB with AHSA1/START domain